MSKVTEEQKALNKAASKLRSAAFKSRRKAYDLARSEAQAAVANSELAARARQADEEAKAFDERHQRECQSLREQIEALNTQLAALMKSPERERVHERRRTVSREYHAKRRQAEEAVEEKFADVCSIFTAAAWRSLDEFLPAAAAGRQPQDGGSNDVAPTRQPAAPDESGYQS